MRCEHSISKSCVLAALPLVLCGKALPFRLPTTLYLLARLRLSPGKAQPCPGIGELANGKPQAFRTAGAAEPLTSNSR